MRQGMILAGLMLLACAGCARRVTQLSDFKKYTSSAGRFSIEFPGEPELSDHPTDTKFGTITAHAFILHLGPTEYIASYTDFPETLADVIKRAGAEKHLQAVGPDIARLTQSRIVSDKKVSLGKWPGHEWDLESVGRSTEDSRWRCYLVGDRQYRVGAGWFRGSKPSDEVLSKFFNSLTILAN
jgi:hypothetical protein